jgi:hypothetical protein
MNKEIQEVLTNVRYTFFQDYAAVSGLREKTVVRPSLCRVVSSPWGCWSHAANADSEQGTWSHGDVNLRGVGASPKKDAKLGDLISTPKPSNCKARDGLTEPACAAIDRALPRDSTCPSPLLLASEQFWSAHFFHSSRNPNGHGITLRRPQRTPRHLRQDLREPRSGEYRVTKMSTGTSSWGFRHGMGKSC